MADLLLRHGQVVLPDGALLDHASVLVDDGRISGVGADGSFAAARPHQTVDLAGAVVLPGLIDTHFHVGFHSAERDWETETRAALLGGVTTVCRYFRHLGTYDDTLPADLALGERTSYVDFAVHLGLLTEAQLLGLPRWVADHGVRSFKMYTCYKDESGAALGIRGQDDGYLLAAFRALAAEGDVVANVHCENQDIVDRATAAAADPHDLRDLARWSAARPPIAEAEAIRRVAYLAREAGASLFIPHVSGDAALAAVEEAKATGQSVWAETCPHYLVLDTSARAGVLAKINPPIRSRADAQGLWAALQDGRIDVVGSDHGTTMRAAKHVGDPLGSAPGFQGVGTILPALLDQGVARGRLTLGSIARIQANAARIFRLPGKGRIEVGADADLTVVDLTRTRQVEASMLGGASDFSVFEGMMFQGWPTMTFLRGTLSARDGQVVVQPGGGRYLRR